MKRQWSPNMNAQQLQLIMRHIQHRRAMSSLAGLADGLRTPSPSLALVWIATSIAAACATSTEPTEPIEEQPVTGLNVIGGSDVSDTVDAELGSPLLVELRDKTGATVAGAELSFDGLNDPEGRRVVLVASEDDRQYALQTTQETDSTGRAAVKIRLGHGAGPATVAVTRSGTGETATASYEILHGTPSQFILAPGDTTVYAGASYSLAVSLVDRYSNLATESQDVSVLTPETITRAASGEITTLSVGRGMIRIEGGGVMDTAFVSVPPVGAIVVARAGSCCPTDRFQLRTFNLDGSDVEQLLAVEYPPPSTPTWGPDGSIAFNLAPEWYGDEVIRVIRDGQLQPPFSAASAVAIQLNPRYSSDGDWIYFNSVDGGIWRVGADDSALEELLTDGQPGGIIPGPSPDNTQVVFQQGVATGSLVVLDIAGGSTQSLGVLGRSPRWSPDGEWIAYISDGTSRDELGMIGLIRGNGSDGHVLDTGPARFNQFLDWSPDGDYLVADQWGGVLTIVVVESGEVVPLPYTIGQHYERPAWRPYQ